MFEPILKIAEISINPKLFLIGFGMVYFTGIILLIAVGFKFLEHAKHRQVLEKKKDHLFSTYAMTLCVLSLFSFWMNSIGQLQISDVVTQYIYFAVGSVMLLFATVWHIWAKVNIGFMWSDGIEIKKNHTLITHGAYALARHPMYASLLMWCWGASLITFNWATILCVTFVFLPLMIFRAKAEEKNLVEKNRDYLFYQNNVRMLTPTTTGVYSVVVRLFIITLMGYYATTNTLTLSSLLLIFLLHLYFGYSFLPEKVAFSFRSKSFMVVLIGLLSIYAWNPFIYFYYVIMTMSLIGLKWNCPCMLVYEKYHGCPCFALAKKCFRAK